MAGRTARKRLHTGWRVRVGHWAARLFDWVIPAEHAEGLVYGVITVGALLAAESGAHDSYADAVGPAAIPARSRGTLRRT